MTFDSTSIWARRSFWIVTVFFAASMALSAVLYLTGAPSIQDGFARLGYPQYLLTILGIAKLLGAAALVQNSVPRLREWAYAGFTIDLIGAVASHVFAGDPMGIAAAPGFFLLPLFVSYVLRPDLPWRLGAGTHRVAATA